MDIMMPTMNGIEMLTNVKADPSTKDIPVIVLTNIADMNITQMALSKGAVLCIIKSQTEPEDVVNSVRAVLSRNAAATGTPDQTQAPEAT